MGFRMQDLMTDVWPGRGLLLANERCTCAASAQTGAQPENAALEEGFGEIPGIEPEDEPVCRDVTLPSAECPPDQLAAALVALKAQLRGELAGR